ncbi:hypothetical protein ISCGN_017092 [Ixodes scapularis]
MTRDVTFLCYQERRKLMTYVLYFAKAVLAYDLAWVVYDSLIFVIWRLTVYRDMMPGARSPKRKVSKPLKNEPPRKETFMQQVHEQEPSQHDPLQHNLNQHDPIQQGLHKDEHLKQDPLQHIIPQHNPIQQDLREQEPYKEEPLQQNPIQHDPHIFIVLALMCVLVLFCDTALVPATDTKCRFGGCPDESPTGNTTTQNVVLVAVHIIEQPFHMWQLVGFCPNRAQMPSWHLGQESLQILTSLPRWLPDQQPIHKAQKCPQGRKQQKQAEEMVRKQQKQAEEMVQKQAEEKVRKQQKQAEEMVRRQQKQAEEMGRKQQDSKAEETQPLIACMVEDS